MYTSKSLPLADRQIRRAAAACYRCHWRKVRCDAAVLGSPCTNCSLDGLADCTLRPNATTRYKKIQKRNQKRSPPNPISPDSFSSSENESAMSEASTIPQSSTLPEIATEMELPLETGLGGLDHDPHLQNTDSISARDTSSVFPGLQFLNLDGLSCLPMNAVQSLSINGCLDIPARPELDVFVRTYFSLLHPSLPILNETQFWNAYLLPWQSQADGQKVSLFVFQAMLLASCSVRMILALLLSIVRAHNFAIETVVCRFSCRPTLWLLQRL